MILDIFVLVVLLISAGIAFMRGFIREVLTIAGVLGGLAAAYFGAPLLIPTMEGWLGVVEGQEVGRLFGVLPFDVLAMGLSYALIFVVVVVILSVISHFLAEGVKSMGLGAIDRTLGFIFGIVRGVIVLGLLYLPLHLFLAQEAKDEWFGSSKTHVFVEGTATFFAKFVSQEGQDIVQEKGHGLLDKANQFQETREVIDAVEGAGASAADGYDEEFRQEMDALFEREGDPAQRQPQYNE